MFDKTMLLDGDIFLYMVTTQCEEEIKWDDDLYTLHSDFKTCRDKLADTATSSSSSTINSSGIAPVRQSGRYMRANVKIPAESLWTHAQGIDLTASQGGSR